MAIKEPTSVADRANIYKKLIAIRERERIEYQRLYVSYLVSSYKY